MSISQCLHVCKGKYVQVLYFVNFALARYVDRMALADKMACQVRYLLHFLKRCWSQVIMSD